MTTEASFSKQSDANAFVAAMDTPQIPQRLLAGNRRLRMRARIFQSFVILAIAATMLYSPKQASAQNVGIGTTTPNASALLDLTSTSLGFLVPRMNNTSMLAISNPATGLLVWNITNNEFYYYNGTAWVPFLSGWSLTGNSSTNPVVNFVGTTDAEPLVFKTNGSEGFRLALGGLIGIGITNPTQKLEISGNTKIDTSGNFPSQLQFEANGGFYITSFQAGSQSANINYLLPTAQGAANTFLTNNGSGTLSWTSAGNYSWLLTGNSGTTPGTNFLGTSDATDFVLKANSSEVVRITSGGLVGVGNSTPTQKFEVHGNVKIDTSSGGSSQLQFSNPAGTFITSFQAGTQTLNLNYTLPISQGAANTVLTDNGSGVLSWSAPGSAYDWTLLGNSGTVDGTNFLGTTDNIPFTIRVNNLQAVRIEPTSNGPTIIAGYQGNNDYSYNVSGSVIAGGGAPSNPNQVSSNYDFIGGGTGNVAGDGLGSSSEANYIVIGGGSGNAATGFSSSILGGEFHLAGGKYSSILGGEGDITYGFSQSVVGQFNDPNPTSACSCISNSFLYPAFIVGGGTSSTSASRYNSAIIDFRGVMELGEEGVNSNFSAVPELKISGSTSGFVGFKAAAATTSHAYVMPAAQGAASTVLTNDGSGNLSWSVAGAGRDQHFGTTTLGTFTSTQNDLYLDSTKSIFRISSSVNMSVTGLADTSDGRYVVITNTGAKTISFTNQDAGSQPVDRILTGTGSSLSIAQDQSLGLYYDGITNRWRVVSQTP